MPWISLRGIIRSFTVTLSRSSMLSSMPWRLTTSFSLAVSCGASLSFSWSALRAGGRPQRRSSRVLQPFSSQSSGEDSFCSHSSGKLAGNATRSGFRLAMALPTPSPTTSRISGSATTATPTPG
ncbi:hypothetical protein D9M71_747920 [compost metagenome]